MGKIVIRRASPADREVIARNNSAMARETEGKVLDTATLAAGVEEILEHPHRGFYQLAEVDGEIVAQLMVTFEWSDWRNGDFWWIQSVYVAREHRRCGVFSALYRQVEADARNAGRVAGLRLYTDRDNQVAQDVYRSLGMKPSRYDMYEFDWSPQ